MNRSRIGLTLFVVAALMVCPLLSHAQDTVTTHSVQLTMVKANLAKTLDAKKAKPGDTVAAKLQYEAKLADGTTLPRNTELTGHVDRVQPSQGKSDSLIQITFDKAVLKSGKTIPVKATIMKLDQLFSPFQSAEGGDTGTSVSPSSAATAGSQSAQGSSFGGVTLESDPQEGYSGIFTSSHRNVRVSGGTEMQIAIAPLPSAAPAQ